jgi:leader peptidase (prepilin peptidase) / N-methyltransferase
MIELIIIFILGSIIGSFLNVCIYRLPQKISLVFPSSFCPACKEKIPTWSNIPIIGFFMVKGKCRACSSKISKRYPFVEILSGILTVVSFIHFGLGVSFFIYSLFIYFLIVIAFIDLKTHLIYNKVLFALLAAGISTQLFSPFITWEEGLLGFVAGGLSMFLISLLGKVLFKKESLGMGDVKLAAVAGFFTGWVNVLMALYLGFVLAFVTIIIYNKFQKTQIKNDHIPLGPFLALGLILFLFWGDQILQFYLSIVL